MRKSSINIILSIFLIVPSLVYGNPSNSISVANPAVSNTLISSSDYNSNNNEIQTKYNSHTHTDITQLGTVTTGVWAGTAITYPFLNLAGQIQPTDVATGYGLVPSGAIMMWSGTVANIPSGWKLCDGTNGTPDLRDKFIVGAKQDDAGVAKTNVTGSLTQTGGATTINLQHNHSVPYNGYSGSTSQPAGTLNITVGGSDTSVTSGQNTGNALSATQSILPVYYALAFIQKS